MKHGYCCFSIFHPIPTHVDEFMTMKDGRLSFCFLFVILHSLTFWITFVDRLSLSFPFCVGSVSKFDVFGSLTLSVAIFSKIIFTKREITTWFPCNLFLFNTSYQIQVTLAKMHIGFWVIRPSRSLLHCYTVIVTAFIGKNVNVWFLF